MGQLLQPTTPATAGTAGTTGTPAAPASASASTPMPSSASTTSSTVSSTTTTPATTPATASHPASITATITPAAPAVPPAPATTLHGHHRVWQVLRPAGELATLGPLKAGRARPGVHRFDPRCFSNEEYLLVELALLGVPHVPPVHRLGPEGLLVHGYIEGETLATHQPYGTPLPVDQLARIADRFRALAGVRPPALELVHGCPQASRPRGSREFLRGLIRFTRRHVYAVHRPEMGGLFAALRVDPEVLAEHGALARAADRLTERPFCLLHGDLHRDNLIVARSDGALWTIDWELAMLGDPVYDLATHLHLMRYPSWQEPTVISHWARAVTEVLPGAAAGLDRDLPRYRAYKRVQSVFTDIIRTAHAVRAAPPADLAGELTRAGEVVSGVLRNAADVLGLEDRVPGPDAVRAAYAAHALPGTATECAIPR